MDYILNHDTLNYIFQFIHPSEHMILSETCKTFNEMIRKKTFPKDSLLFSSPELIEWAIDHEYKIKKWSMFRKAIKYGNTNVLQYLKDNIKNNQWTPRKEVGDTGDINFFKSQIKSNDWNTVHIIVKGNRMQHFINGNLMSDVTDNDLNYQRKDGFLGVQVHVGPPMKIEYKNMKIKTI